MTSTYEPVTSAGTVTSWIPLTTVFTPPASCMNLFSSSAGALNAFDPDYGVNINPNVRCMPDPVTQWWDEDSGPGDRVVYSLGPMSCPYEWGASISTQNATSVLTSCCAPGYSVDDASDTWCFSSATSGVVVTFMNFTTIDSSRTTSNLVTSTLTNTSLLWAVAVVGWNIGAATTTTTTTTTTAPAATSSHTASSIGAPTTSAAHPNSSSSSFSSSGLSAGAAAGIGVGVAVVVLGIAIGAIALFLARRRKRSHAVPPASGDPVEMEQPYTSPGNGYGAGQYYDPPHGKVELGDTGPAEFAGAIPGQTGTGSPAELGGLAVGHAGNPVELDAPRG